MPGGSKRQILPEVSSQADANHGRWVLPVIPIKMPNMPHNWFITAEKK